MSYDLPNKQEILQKCRKICFSSKYTYNQKNLHSTTPFMATSLWTITASLLAHHAPDWREDVAKSTRAALCANNLLLNPEILRHNVHELWLVRRGKNRHYADLAILMQLQQWRENSTPETAALFKIITQEKLQWIEWRKRVNDAFDTATNGKYKIAWSDELPLIIESNPILKAFKEEIEKEPGRHALSPWWFIDEVIYFEMLRQGLVPVADQHDLYGHLINFCDPVVAKQTQTMVELYHQYIEKYWVTSYNDMNLDIINNRPYNLGQVITSMREYIQESNAQFLDWRITISWGVSTTNAKNRIKHWFHHPEQIMTSAIYLPIQFWSLFPSPNLDKFFRDKFQITFSEFCNEYRRISRECRDHQPTASSWDFIEDYEKNCAVFIKHAWPYISLLNRTIRDQYIQAIYKDIELELSKN